jgi:hypothetical protein
MRSVPPPSSACRSRRQAGARSPGGGASGEGPLPRVRGWLSERRGSRRRPGEFSSSCSPVIFSTRAASAALLPLPRWPCGRPAPPAATEPISPRCGWGWDRAGILVGADRRATAFTSPPSGRAGGRTSRQTAAQVGAAVGVSVGAPIGVSLAGKLLGRDGSFIITWLSSVAGLGVGYGIYGLVRSGSDSSAAKATYALTLLLPVAGAVIGYELTSSAATPPHRPPGRCSSFRSWRRVRVGDPSGWAGSSREAGSVPGESRGTPRSRAAAICQSPENPRGTPKEYASPIPGRPQWSRAERGASMLTRGPIGPVDGGAQPRIEDRLQRCTAGSRHRPARPAGSRGCRRGRWRAPPAGGP